MQRDRDAHESAELEGDLPRSSNSYVLRESINRHNEFYKFNDKNPFEAASPTIENAEDNSGYFN